MYDFSPLDCIRTSFIMIYGKLILFLYYWTNFNSFFQMAVSEVDKKIPDVLVLKSFNPPAGGLISST